MCALWQARSKFLVADKCPLSVCDHITAAMLNQSVTVVLAKTCLWLEPCLMMMHHHRQVASSLLKSAILAVHCGHVQVNPEVASLFEAH